MEWIKLDKNGKIKIDKKYSKELIICLIATILMLTCGYLSEIMPKNK